MERDGGYCIVCGRPGSPWCHYIPRSHGGRGIAENIITLCDTCHFLYDQSYLRRPFKSAIEHYLKSKYPDWDETKLIYKKGT